MNTKMTQKAAQILVDNNYAHSIPVTYNFIPQKDTVYVQMVAKPDPNLYGQYEEVDPFADTLDGRRQLDILEKHYRINTQQNTQGDVNTSASDDQIRSAGCDPRYGRLSCIESCLRQDANNMKYDDYIGANIQYVINPYDFDSPHEALTYRLKEYIEEDDLDTDGLICNFRKIDTEISAGMIIVSGTVTVCEIALDN